MLLVTCGTASLIERRFAVESVDRVTRGSSLAAQSSADRAPVRRAARFSRENRAFRFPALRPKRNCSVLRMTTPAIMLATARVQRKVAIADTMYCPLCRADGNSFAGRPLLAILGDARTHHAACLFQER